MTEPRFNDLPTVNISALRTTLRQQQLRRLRQAQRLTQLTLLGVSIICLLMGLQNAAVIMLCTGVWLFVIDWCVMRHRHMLGATLFLVSCTLSLTYVAWIGNGLRDLSLVGYCGLIVFAAAFGNKRLLLGLLLLIYGVIAIMTWSNFSGWHIHDVKPIGFGTGVVAMMTFSLVSLGAWFLGNDYQSSLEQLAHQHSRVQSAKHHIHHLAMHDGLTGLPNRIMAANNFDALYQQAQLSNSMLGIIFIDLDNLKPINDSLGHQAGDQILKEVALRLLSFTKSSERVCRFGGDEFIVFLPDITSEEDASAASRLILQIISDNYVYRGIEIFCTCSIGIALAPQDGEDLDTLIKKADIAMYHSKDSGRNSFRFFNSAISHSMHDHISLISGMRKALSDNQFSLYYQPKIDLASNRICGVEALLRWHHPEQGFISPATFIPLAESSGLIIQLGEWVVNEACKQAKRWLDAGLLDFTIAVNISSIQFKRGNIDSIVLNALAYSGLPAHYLELELTESLLIDDSERLSQILSALRAEGVHFAIDDFGTGYSNLGYLKRFEVESLKIDQSFVRKMAGHDGDAAIVKAIIQMAASLGLETVAEGVEDETTARLLKDLGCGSAQGYFWARPMPSHELEQFCKHWQVETV